MQFSRLPCPMAFTRRIYIRRAFQDAKPAIAATEQQVYSASIVHWSFGTTRLPRIATCCQMSTGDIGCAILFGHG